MIFYNEDDSNIIAQQRLMIFEGPNHSLMENQLDDIWDFPFIERFCVDETGPEAVDYCIEYVLNTLFDNLKARNRKIMFTWISGDGDILPCILRAIRHGVIVFFWAVSPNEGPCKKLIDNIRLDAGKQGFNPDIIARFDSLSTVRDNVLKGVFAKVLDRRMSGMLKNTYANGSALDDYSVYPPDLDVQLASQSRRFWTASDQFAYYDVRYIAQKKKLSLGLRTNDQIFSYIDNWYM